MGKITNNDLFDKDLGKPTLMVFKQLNREIEKLEDKLVYETNRWNKLKKAIGLSYKSKSKDIHHLFDYKAKVSAFEEIIDKQILDFGKLNLLYQKKQNEYLDAAIKDYKSEKEIDTFLRYLSKFPETSGLFNKDKADNLGFDTSKVFGAMAVGLLDYYIENEAKKQ